MRPKNLRSDLPAAIQAEIMKDLAARSFILRKHKEAERGTPERLALWLRSKAFTYMAIAKRHGVSYDTVLRYNERKEEGSPLPISSEERVALIAAGRHTHKGRGLPR